MGSTDMCFASVEDARTFRSNGKHIQKEDWWAL